jgi:hypothetical protein
MQIELKCEWGSGQGSWWTEYRTPRLHSLAQRGQGKLQLMHPTAHTYVPAAPCPVAGMLYCPTTVPLPVGIAVISMGLTSPKGGVPVFRVCAVRVGSCGLACSMSVCVCVGRRGGETGRGDGRGQGGVLGCKFVLWLTWSHQYHFSCMSR